MNLKILKYNNKTVNHLFASRCKKTSTAGLQDCILFKVDDMTLNPNLRNSRHEGGDDETKQQSLSSEFLPSVDNSCQRFPGDCREGVFRISRRISAGMLPTLCYIRF